MLTDTRSRRHVLKKPAILIDTNIFLDVFLQRSPFYEDSRAILELCEKRTVLGFLTASSITDLFYILRKGLHDTKAAYEALGAVLDIAKIIPVTDEDILKAYSMKAPDFEDCLLATCASTFGCDLIVTRNCKDFSAFSVKAEVPKAFLDKYL